MDLPDRRVVDGRAGMGCEISFVLPHGQREVRKKLRAAGILLFSLFLFSAILAHASSPLNNEVDARPKRIYCNVYTSIACFNIEAGDKLEMSLPADFLLYDIQLASSMKVRIYQGHNPGTDVFKSARPCKAQTGTSRCSYVRSASAWDVLYDSGIKNRPLLHIHVEAAGGEDSDKIVHAFLGGFHPCARSATALTCTHEQIFSEID